MVIHIAGAAWQASYGIRIKKFGGGLARVLLASGVTEFIIFYLRDLTLWGLIPLSVVTYFAIVYLVGA